MIDFSFTSEEDPEILVEKVLEEITTVLDPCCSEEAGCDRDWFVVAKDVTVDYEEAEEEVVRELTQKLDSAHTVDEFFAI